MNKSRMMQAALGIVIITSLSKIIGFFREVLIASRFGSTMMTDAFFVADSVTSFIFRFAGAGLGFAIIPIIARIRNEKSIVEERRYISQMNFLFTFIAIILMTLGYFFAKPIVKVFAIGFKGEQLLLAVKLVRIGLPMILFNMMFTIFETYNHSLNKFFIPASSGVILNVPIIVYLLTFYDEFGIEGLVVSFVIGYVLRTIYMFVPTGINTKLFSRFTLSDEFLKNTLSIMIPVVLTSMIAYVNLVVDKTLASRLTAGSISALSYAAKTKGIVTGIFVTSIVTVIYPQLADAISKENRDKTKKMFTYGINIILLIVIPCAIGLSILSYPIVKIIFMHGAFDETAVAMTSSALRYYSFGIIGVAVGLMVNKIYYSLHDSKTTMKIGIITVTTNIVLNLILVGPMKHNGLALATSIAASLGTIIKLKMLKYKPIDTSLRENLSVLLKATFAASIMGILVYYMANSVVDLYSGSSLINFAKLILIILSGVMVYGAIIYSLKIEEIRDIVERIINISKKKKVE